MGYFYSRLYDSSSITSLIIFLLLISYHIQLITATFGSAVEIEHFEVTRSDEAGRIDIHVETTTIRLTDDDHYAINGYMIAALVISMSLNLATVVIILFVCYALRAYRPWQYVTIDCCLFCGMRKRIINVWTDCCKSSVDAPENRQLSRERDEIQLENLMVVDNCPTTSDLIVC